MLDEFAKHAGQIECKRLVKCNSIERSVPMQSDGQVECNFTSAAGTPSDLRKPRMTSTSPTDNVSAMNDPDPTPSIPTIHSHNESECTEASKNDQVLFEFLSLLEDDIQSNPESLIALDSSFMARLESLIGGIDVDTNSPLSADDE